MRLEGKEGEEENGGEDIGRRREEGILNREACFTDFEGMDPLKQG